jgi:hypothetical protein
MSPDKAGRKNAGQIVQPANLPKIECPPSLRRTANATKDEVPPNLPASSGGGRPAFTSGIQMASKKRSQLAQVNCKQVLKILPAPQCARDVLVLLKFSAEVAPANAKMATHLTEMGTLFPEELLGAFRAFLKRQVSDN